MCPLHELCTWYCSRHPEGVNNGYVRSGLWMEVLDTHLGNVGYTNTKFGPSLLIQLKQYSLRLLQTHIDPLGCLPRGEKASVNKLCFKST